MQITVLAAIVMAMTAVELPPSGLAAGLALPAAAAYVLLSGAIAAINSRLACWGLAAGEGLWRGVAMRHSRIGLSLQLWLVLGLGGAIWLGQPQWSDLIERLRPIPLAATALLMTPFVGALVLTWLFDYPFHRAYRTRLAEQRALDDLVGSAAPRVRGPWSLREFLGYNLRHEFLFIAAPVGLIVLLRDVLQVYVTPLVPESISGWAIPTAMSLTSLGVFLVAPAMIVHIWRTCPMGDGPLKIALEAVGQRMNIKFRRILIWQSGGLIANAAVMGLVSRFRYVLLSDGLLEQMSAGDILAVFAHEAQHVKGRHIMYSLLFAFSTAVLCTYAADLAGTLLTLDPLTVEVAALGLLVLAWAFGFGWISRRFERQSDVNGAAVMSQMQAADLPTDSVSPQGAAAFAHALQAIAMLNGMSTTHRNWRHGSIGNRISYLLWLGSTLGSRRHIDSIVRLIKLGLWAATAVSAAAMTFGQQLLN